MPTNPFSPEPDIVEPGKQPPLPDITDPGPSRPWRDADPEPLEPDDDDEVMP